MLCWVAWIWLHNYVSLQHSLWTKWTSPDQDSILNKCMNSSFWVFPAAGRFKSSCLCSSASSTSWLSWEMEPLSVLCVRTSSSTSPCTSFWGILHSWRSGTSTPLFPTHCLTSSQTPRPSLSLGASFNHIFSFPWAPLSASFSQQCHLIDTLPSLILCIMPQLWLDNVVSTSWLLVGCVAFSGIWCLLFLSPNCLSVAPM